MKKLQSLGRELSKLEQMKIKGGEEDDLEESACRADGRRCSFTKACCGYCKGTGFCGPV